MIIDSKNVIKISSKFNMKNSLLIWIKNGFTRSKFIRWLYINISKVSKSRNIKSIDKIRWLDNDSFI